MRTKDIYKVVLFVIANCYSFPTEGQIITITNKQVFYAGIYPVENSLLKKEAISNAIIYTDAINHLFLIKDSLHWKGYLFRNTIGPVPQGYVMNGDGDTIFKPVQTVLYQFNGDSLYHFLYANKILILKQFSDDQIADMYARRRSKGKNVRYGLPYSSHDSDVTIKIPSSKKNITYRWSLIEDKDLHFIPTIKTFFVLGQILHNTY
jgi:hypothetical protein